jgi:hypothetical protein
MQEQRPTGAQPPHTHQRQLRQGVRLGQNHALLCATLVRREAQHLSLTQEILGAAMQPRARARDGQAGCGWLHTPAQHETELQQLMGAAGTPPTSATNTHTHAPGQCPRLPPRCPLGCLAGP